MNRVWPGSERGSITDQQAWLVWNRLLKDNVDSVIDFHTAGAGADFTFFIFVDFRKAEARQLAELFPVAQIKNDPGLAGTLETAFVIPAITVEVSGPRSFDPPKTLASVEGVRNVLAHYGLTDGKVGRSARDSNEMEVIRASNGGFVELLVKLGEKVTAGQKVAIQRNSFGDVVQEYKTPVDGEVAILGTDALKDPGARLVEILTNNPDPNCADSGCPYEGDED